MDNQRRKRSDTLTKINRLLPVPIELDDNSRSEEVKNSQITSVLVGDYFEISGENGISYIVWCIKITLNESMYSSINIYKRYSDIERFRNKLIEAFPNVEIPQLPPKDSFNLQRLLSSVTWIENRRKGLQWFMNYVLLNPKFQHTSIVNDFLLS